MILQFVGFQNSGKTTAMEWTIQSLSEKGFKVIAIKHHGHGGPPNTLVKDSTKYNNAGAIASLVEGDGVLHLELTQQHWNIEKMLSLISSLDYDLLLIEGYKHEHYPKVVFTSSGEEHAKLTSLFNIQFTIPYCQNLEDKWKHVSKVIAWLEGELVKKET
ncbi:molybdopterin-guanine dinucleotide biosynthesis protein B [Niallia circulans]|uniref:Molybdopterin-guanine dinucleotide biosynthesis protein B n=1 Tax=Niallia circulans TaxID=1397 RepID=A0A553SSM3_NIACI|nr:molybdopterin-guanine dinucleotide biosynthesis protein B [Niallia circulans]TRZ39997.1 molybdopterin-guanine dinucleotide biosynthesis protein B [Niallia circulans]